MRQILAKLDNTDSPESLSQEDLVSIRRQLSEGQSLVRETIDRLRQSQEVNELVTRRRDELEARVSGLEAEYEELLGNLRLTQFSSLISLLEQRRQFMTKRLAMSMSQT